MSSFSSTTTFSMSSFTTIPAATAKQPYLASPYLSSPFAPSTPLNYSPTQPSTAASTSSALHMLDARTDDEVFDLAFHPTQPLLVAGLITGELQLYRLDGKLEAPSKSTAGTGLKSVKEEDEDEDEEDDEIGGEDESGSSFDESGEEDEEAVLLKPSYLAAPTLLSTSCPHTASIRSIAFSNDGTRLYTASSDHSIAAFALTDSELRPLHSIQQAHGCAVNVVKVGSGDREGMLATGDDDGYVKVWDMRQPNHAKQQQPQHRVPNTGEAKGQKRKRRKTGKPQELKDAAASQSTAVMSFAESGDYISDLLMSESHLLLSSSGDGHLQVFDLRRAGSWYAQSEAVDDDLLSLCCVVKKRGKGSVERRRKVLVGSKESGVHVYSWDWFGRPDEHFAYPDSADCIVELATPATTANVIAIGSSEGSIGLATLWPHAIQRTVGRHAGGQPVEAVRLSGLVRVGGGGGGGWLNGIDDEDGGRDTRWLVSAGHDKRIRLWDVTSVCEEGIQQEEEEEEDDSDEDELGDEDAEDEEEIVDEAAAEDVDEADVKVPRTADVGQAIEDSDNSDASDAETPAQPSGRAPGAAPTGGLDRSALVAALKRKIAAAKEEKAAQRKAAGQTAESSSDEDDDSSDEDRPHKAAKGAQQTKRRILQQQQPKKKKAGGGKVKGFFDGL